MNERAPLASHSRDSSAGADLGAELVARIASSPLETWPFDHVCLEDVLPPARYRRLLDALPETGRYREFQHRDAMQPDGTSARRKFYLYPEHLVFLPAAQRPVWREVTRALRSPGLQAAFKEKFHKALERRFGRGVDRLSFYPLLILLRDRPGYRIGVHGDSLSKAITVQIYLPADDTQTRLGTVLHETRDADDERVKRLAFRPASGYGFPVLRHETWHSVPRTQETDRERNSMMLTYYVQDGLWSWLTHRIKRVGLFLAYGLRR